MRASGSSVRSTTSTSASSSGATGSWPAALSAPWSFDPNSRSGHSSATRATPARLLRSAPVELLAHRLGPAPHLNHLDAPRARLAQRQLAVDLLGVEQSEGAAHRLGCRGVPEGVGRADAPVPI